MAPARSSIGYPWILDAIKKYNGETSMLKAAPAQVVEFLKMPERTDECQYPGAVVHISDRQYYIRAIITREAQETLERENEHFTLAHIKNKFVILKKCTLSFAAEEDLRCCEFYLTIHHFCILAMEINTVDLLNCNMEPGVMKKIKELWQLHITELQKKETISDMNSSDISLTQLLMIASEEKLNDLKSLALQCLDLDSFATQEISPQARTMWSMEMRNNKNNNNRFSVPINLLLIPPEEEAALEQMSEFRPDVNSASDLDTSSDGTDSSQPYTSALSTLSQDDACTSEAGNPWNNLPSLCDSRSLGSVVFEPSVAQQNSEQEPATDSDSTPDILSEPSSHQIQPEADISTNTKQTEASSSDSLLCSSQGGILDYSQSLLKPLIQDYSSNTHISPIRKVALENKMPISPILTHGSESKLVSKAIRNIFPANSMRSKETCHSPREWRAVKRKQAVEDLDTILSDSEQQEPVPKERPECAATSNGTQTDSVYEERAETTDLGKTQSRTEQTNKATSAELSAACATKQLGKKALQCKPCLEFVIKQKMKVAENLANAQPAADLPTASGSGCKDAPSVFQGRPSTAQAPIFIEMKKTKMTHYDGKPFQYKYKPPSADLCTRVNTVRIPADLHEWAVKILSDAKQTNS